MNEKRTGDCLQQVDHIWVIIKIHALFPVHILVTSNIFVPVLLQPISFSYITMTYSHNMQSGKPPRKKIFLDMQHPLIPFSPWCYQHKIILFRKMKNICYVKSGYIHNIQGNYAQCRICSLEHYYFSQYLDMQLWSPI